MEDRDREQRRKIEEGQSPTPVTPGVGPRTVAGTDRPSPALDDTGRDVVREGMGVDVYTAPKGQVSPRRGTTAALVGLLALIIIAALVIGSLWLLGVIVF